MRNGRGSYDDDVAELEELFRRAAEDAKKSMKPGSEGKIAEAIWREMNGEAGEVKKDWGESAQNGMEMVYNENDSKNNPGQLYAKQEFSPVKELSTKIPEDKEMTDEEAFELLKPKENQNAEGEGRDGKNAFSAAGLGLIFGMKYDNQTGMYYHSKGGWQWQKALPYADATDGFASLIFDIDSPKTQGVFRDEDTGKEIQVTHRVWIGDYAGRPLLKSSNIVNWGSSGFYGGESSLLFGEGDLGGNRYLQDDVFEQNIIVKDTDGNEIINFDSREMFDDKTADWAYGCKPSAKSAKSIEGTIWHDNPGILRAIAEGESQDGIVYGEPTQDENGKWSLTWSYQEGDEQKNAAKRKQQ